MLIVPITHATAKRFVAHHHRHNRIPLPSAVFVIGLEDAGELVGVAIAGMPKAGRLMDGATLEVNRACVIEGHRNANSMLYGACARAATALGWSRLVTYTLTTESGASLKAAGWKADEEVREHNVKGWENRGRSFVTDMFGTERIPTGPKIRWWKQLVPATAQVPASPPAAEGGAR